LANNGADAAASPRLARLVVERLRLASLGGGGTTGGGDEVGLAGIRAPDAKGRPICCHAAQDRVDVRDGFLLLVPIVREACERGFDARLLFLLRLAATAEGFRQRTEA